jgi:uncharacterized protein (DUF433 family)
MSAVASYVRQREGEFFVGDSRVTVQTIVANWQRRVTPEEIQAAFPSLSLVEIYGTITYYLEHQAALDEHFRDTSEMLAEHQAAVEAKHPEFFADMRARLAAYRAARSEQDEHHSNRQP